MTGPGGEDQLSAGLNTLADGRPKRVAAAAIDLSASPCVRFAFIGAAASTRFEIGSITKGLTGMLLADSISEERSRSRPESAMSSPTPRRRRRGRSR